MRIVIIGLLVLLSLSASVAAQSIVGVWEITDEATTGPDAKTRKVTQPGMYVFTRKHYSIIWVTSDAARPAIDSSTATAEQLRDVFVDSFVANAGKYDLGAGKLSLWPSVAKSPTLMHGGYYSTYSVKFTNKGKTLTITSIETNGYPVKTPTTLTFKRVE